MFDLSDEIVDQLIFSMEDQDNDYSIDMDDGRVINLDASDTDDSIEPDGDESEIQAPMPAWTSRNGFSLMERFTESISDPSLRQELTAALSRGRGVFRAFKDLIDKDRAVTERWYDFKRIAMKRVISEWYDDLREARGLERLGPEPEETCDLVLSDYTVRRYDAGAWRDFTALFDASLSEDLDRFPEPVVEYAYAKLENELLGDDVHAIWIAAAENAAGSVEAVAAAHVIVIGERSFCRLFFLYVASERRRFGLGSTLVDTVIKWCGDEGIAHFLVDLPFLVEGFGSHLERSGFHAFGSRFLKSEG
ncbi:MAG: UPF0158 family protein [Spirochaetes bacterium]|nr:UPF0158 family protein [Spirochaetota bacterium]